MTLGDVVLGLAVAAAALALPAWRGRDLAARLHVGLVVAAFALLAVDLLVGTLRYQYAWAHSHAGHAWYYRLAGLWGGEEGTVLLWNAVVALALLAVARGREALDRRARDALVLLSGTLAGAALSFGAFAATSPHDLAQAPLGRGLADVLLTPLMVIHPPVQFVGYGLMSVPAAYALASLWEPPGDGAWAGRAFRWARAAWLFATLGLALGALWAYYVLSFGGYWAWDAVETSNLLPWLALTAFLHAGKQRMRGQGHATASLVLAYAAFLLTLFATFATRSGLWVSVHAFTDPTERFEPDAPARLIAILDAHLPSRVFLGLFGAALLAGVALWTARRVPGRAAKAYAVLLLALAGSALLAPADAWSALFAAGSLATPTALGAGALLALIVGAPFVLAFARGEDAHAPLTLSVRTLLATSVALLSIALGVAFLLNLQVVNGPDRGLFDRRAPFLAVPIASALTLMLAQAPLGRRGALALTGGALTLGVAGWWVFPQARVLGLAAPVASAATLAAVLKLAHVQGASAPRAWRVAGALTLLASLLGVLLWSNPPTDLGAVHLRDAQGLALAALGLALSTVGLLGAVAAFRAASRAWALAGACAAVAAVGYGLGALLALAAVAIILHQPSGEHDKRWLRREAPRLRETGIYLIHLAVALGLLGFAASTYAQTREVVTGSALDAQHEVADYALTLHPARVERDAAGVARVAIPVALTKGGEPAGEEAIAFAWRPGSATYDGELEVRRALLEDIYISPLAFHTPSGWVGADSAAGPQVRDAQVDAVSFSVSVLPLMSLVWASGVLMVLGMGMILAATSAREGAGASKDARPRSPSLLAQQP